MMTIEERIKEIEGRLESGMKGDYRINRLDMQTHSDITFLLSELKRCREGLEKITLGVHVDESHESTAMCAIHSLINVEKLARQALHPEGEK